MAQLEQNFKEIRALKMKDALLEAFEVEAFNEKDAEGIKVVLDLYLQAKEFKKGYDLADRVIALGNEELYHKIQAKLALATAQFIPIK